MIKIGGNNQTEKQINMQKTVKLSLLLILLIATINTKKLYSAIGKDEQIECPNIGIGKYKQIQCDICWEEFEGTEVLTLPCGHCFHKTCINGWLDTQQNPACPYCHKAINVKIHRRIIKYFSDIFKKLNEMVIDKRALG